MKEQINYFELIDLTEEEKQLHKENYTKWVNNSISNKIDVKEYYSNIEDTLYYINKLFEGLQNNVIVNYKKEKWLPKYFLKEMFILSFNSSFSFSTKDRNVNICLLLLMSIMSKVKSGLGMSCKDIDFPNES